MQIGFEEFTTRYHDLDEQARERFDMAAGIIVKLKRESNDIFFPLYFDKKRYLVLMGGGGSGKSMFAGRKIIERTYREAGHTVLVLRKVAKTLRESCFRQLVSQIGQIYDVKKWNISKTDMSITSPTGSRIIFAGLDDVEKLKSIYGITMVWIEEASEISRGDFNQIDIRLRGECDTYRQMILTFNPTSITHWLKERFFDYADENATVVKSTYHHNRFFDESSAAVLEAFRHRDEYHYNVYCLGNWGVMGQSVFGSAEVSRRIGEITPEMYCGEFILSGNNQAYPEMFVTDAGCVRIYEEPSPEYTYVAGCDTAGEGSDRNVCQVVCVQTGMQVAVITLRGDEDRFVYQCVNICRYYNDALLCFESNFSTYPVREALRLGYDNQYIRRQEDTISRRPTPSYGFRTTAVSRPLILSNLMRVFKESPGLIRDRLTLEEMLSFVRTPAGRMEAEGGCHDDHVMALAIAYYILGDVPLAEPSVPAMRKVNFSFEREPEAERVRVV